MPSLLRVYCVIGKQPLSSGGDQVNVSDTEGVTADIFRFNGAVGGEPTLIHALYGELSPAELIAVTIT